MQVGKNNIWMAGEIRTFRNSILLRRQTIEGEKAAIKAQMLQQFLNDLSPKLDQIQDSEFMHKESMQFTIQIDMQFDPPPCCDNKKPQC